ncbi:MAG TPA: LLM class flavin-dependent oxidoreductase [Actinomycetota bacterium]|nr:LLM class flavin-dependent oxidoreductase [Actinomycetota bacterium]
MRVGLNLPQYEIDVVGGLAPSVVAAARAAEQAGFDSVWVSDHPFVVAPDGSVSGALEALTLMGHIAAATSRVAVGSLVLASSMRSVEQLVAGARALSLVAPSRVALGVGAGWYRPEHETFGVPLPSFKSRLATLEANLFALRSSSVTTLVGGVSQSVIDVAARFADSWNCAWDVPVDVFRSLCRDLDEACARAGRDPASVSRSIGVTVLPGARAERLRAVEAVRARAPYLASLDLDALEQSIVGGSYDEIADRIAAYSADEVIVTPFVRDDLEVIARVGEEIASELHA